MKFKSVAAAIALVVAFPGLSQAQESATPVDCLAKKGDRQLASDLVDNILAESGLVEQPVGVNERLIDVARQCIAEHDVSQGDIDAFINRSLAYVVAGEVRRRMIAAGYDIGPVEELLTALASQPDLSVGDYIDARQEQFEIPMNAAMARAGHGREMGIQLLGTYIAMEMVLRTN